MLTAINFPDRPPHPAYSQGIDVKAASRLLFIAGQVGSGADGIVPASIGEQAKLAIANLNAVLAEAGLASSNLVKLTIFLTDAEHLQEFYGAAFGTLSTPPPATTLLIVKALADPALLVEIEGIAAG